MSNDAIDTTTPAVEVEETVAPATTPVLDSKDQPLELRMRVKLLGDKDKDEAGKARFGTIIALRATRQQVVVAVDAIDKPIVRNAKAVMIKKNRSGKIERVPAPARAPRQRREAAPVEVPAAGELVSA